MPIEFERVVPNNPPSIDQLQTLASIGIKSAIERNRYKKHARIQGMHYFVDEYDRTDYSLEEEYLPVRIRHRMAMLVGARPPEDRGMKTWKLTYFDTYNARSIEGSNRGARSIYRFEWDRRGVTMADRALRLTGFNVSSEQGLDYNLENFRIADDAAAILQLSEEIRTVTDEDCEELIKDMSDYFMAADAVANR